MKFLDNWKKTFPVWKIFFRIPIFRLDPKLFGSQEKNSNIQKSFFLEFQLFFIEFHWNFWILNFEQNWKKNFFLFQKMFLIRIHIFYSIHPFGMFFSFFFYSIFQSKRLRAVLDERVEIHGRGNFPTISTKLIDLIRCLRHKMGWVGTGKSETWLKFSARKNFFFQVFSNPRETSEIQNLCFQKRLGASKRRSSERRRRLVRRLFRRLLVRRPRPHLPYHNGIATRRKADLRLYQGCCIHDDSGAYAWKYWKGKVWCGDAQGCVYQEND